MSRIPPTPKEIRDLLGIARRELADADISGLSPEGSFQHAYAAALALATALVRSEGERIHGADHHRLTFERLAELASRQFAEAADYLPALPTSTQHRDVRPQRRGFRSRVG